MSETTRSDRIRDRAYGIWEEEGRTDGHHERHWDQASKEIEDTDAPELPHDAGEAPAAAGETAESSDPAKPAGAAPTSGRAKRESK